MEDDLVSYRGAQIRDRFRALVAESWRVTAEAKELGDFSLAEATPHP